MCGRFAIRRPLAEVVEDFAADLVLFDDFHPSYNVAPSQTVAAVRLKPKGRELVGLRWGLVPSWSREFPAAPPINARAETVATKPTFRNAFKSRRCLWPADGFYEWKREGKHKVPHFIRLADDNLFSFAGLWETWRGPDGEVQTCAHITTEPNEMLAQLHDRMPVILRPDQYETWLDPDAAPDTLISLLRPFPAEEMLTYPVSPRVNSPKNDDPDLIKIDVLERGLF